MTKDDSPGDAHPFDIADQDIYDAMKAMPGYLDITPGDFKDLYKLVYEEAVKRIVESVKASDVMTTIVVTVDEGMLLQEAADIMASRGVSGVPVVDAAHQVVGVLSERDFISRMGTHSNTSFMDVVARCLDIKSCAAIGIRDKKVADIMSTPAVTIEGTMRLPDVAALLKKKQINRVPVVDQEHKLVGIVSREDIVHTSLVPQGLLKE